MAQVIDGRTISVGEILGEAALDSNGAQLKFQQVKDSILQFLKQKELIRKSIVLK